MKKILYVDVESPVGHRAFNLSYLNVLKSDSDCELKCVFKKGYLKDKNIEVDIDEVLTIPDYLYLKRNLGGFINRFFMLLRLLYLKNNIKLCSYDYVIISYYDEISLFFSFLGKRCFLVNHINVSGLNSSVKRFFFKLISKIHTHIVFEDYIKEKLIGTYNINNVVVVKHGLIKPYTVSTKSIDELGAIDSRLIDGSFKHMIFSPSSNSSDSAFMQSIVSNSVFLATLVKNNVLFVIKDTTLQFSHPNVLVISQFITDSQYQSIFLISQSILISYPDTFAYRVSNVLNECISNNKLCFMSDIEPLRAYESKIKYKYYFKSVEQLLVMIDESICKDLASDSEKYFCLDDLKPLFSGILQ